MSLAESSLAHVRLTPIFSARPARARHLVERGAYAYRRNWFFLVSGFFEPFFYLLSITVGLSHLVGSVVFAGHVLAYTHFVAPGLLATSAMNGAVLDTTFNFFFKLKVTKLYTAVVATPLSVGDVTLGEAGWAICRGTIYSVGFLAVMAAFGLISSMWAIVCLPVATLIAATFACVGLAATSYLKSWQGLSGILIALLPMFLFSGTFYAMSVYPHPVALVIEATPLYQGVVLCRAFANGLVGPGLIGHACYLVVLAGLCLVVAARRLTRLLTP